MSIGDSLLDYFSEEDIKENSYTNVYPNQKYYVVEFIQLESFNIFNNFVANIEANDSNYIIASMGGTIFFKNNMNNCYKKQKEIVKELSNFFEDPDIVYEDLKKHTADKSGKSKYKQTNFWLKSGGLAVVACTNWSKEITDKYGWTDNLNLSLRTEKFNDFLGIAFD